MSSSSSATDNMEAATADHYHQQLVEYGGGVGSSSTPRRCAACKYLRRRYAPDCVVLAPYFPASQPRRYADVHAVFGTSNATRLLQERGRAADTMAAEARRWRVQDPVYGCTGVIDRLQQEIRAEQRELATTRAQLAAVHLHGAAAAATPQLMMPPVLAPQAPLAPPAAVVAVAVGAHAGSGGGNRAASGHEEEEDSEALLMDPDEFLDLDGRF